MRVRKPSGLPHSQRQERGVALIVALVLLVVMTLLGLTAMRSVSLEEKMSGHTYDRSIAFQATEAALREAEALVEANKLTYTPGLAANNNDCTSGVCGLVPGAFLERWNDSSFTGWTNATPVSSSSITVTPQYFIEYLGNKFPCNPDDLTQVSDCKRYRVTARTSGGTDRASVMLQSVYATD